MRRIPGRAVYINLGTLPVYEQTVPATARLRGGAPGCLDPVGIGIGSLRTQLIEAVHESRPSCAAMLRSSPCRAVGLAGDSSDDAFRRLVLLAA